MRYRTLRRCLIIIFALLIVSALFSKDIWGIAKERIQPHPDPIENQQPPEADKRGTLDVPFIVKTIPAEKSQQEAAEDATNKNDKRWNDRITIGIGIATAVILTLQLIVFGWQAHRLKQTIVTMRDLGKEQREIGEAQIRAYVSIKAATIEFMFDAIVPCVRFIAYNSGQSPARNFVWNITLQYFGGRENRESKLSDTFIEQTGIDIPATSDSHVDGALIPDMSVRQHIEGTNTGLMITVLRAKIDFRFTDVFGKDWFGEAFFGGTMRMRQVSQEDAQRGVSRWVSQISPMAKPSDWDEVGKSKKS